ncbi:Protein of unknown function [Novosphingobium sp. CF614]|uniref:DUF3052 family protein n=1 Tax=Novosphingobium sp. CF614 TaxID=1884364 RepID=UPI0008E15587|nr:DUF3052 family protein [Novosphingobium sp. CF614]SFF95555.1 Protein of unknown function [Novosphingobium sp. CF614]
MPAGYSGKPLAAKLGYKAGQRAWFHEMPAGVRDEIGETGLVFQDSGDAAQAVHIFVTAKDEMARLLTDLRTAIDPAGMVWVSWPKKASKVPTDVTEDTIRDVCLPMGWVDVKVCAVDAVWSGLKLMIRKELRQM